MTIQTDLIFWDFKNKKISRDRLKEAILHSMFKQGFVMDFGNGIVAETYEDYLSIMNTIHEVMDELKRKTMSEVK